MLTGTWYAAAQDRGVPDSDARTGRLNGNGITIREVGSLGSESIYTNTCQFEVLDQ